MATSWRLSGWIRSLSTCSPHLPRQTSHTAQRKQKDGTRISVQCTDAVVLYNKYMAGLDRGDQLRQYYRIRSKCRKYPSQMHSSSPNTPHTNPQQPAVSEGIQTVAGRPADWQLLLPPETGPSFYPNFHPTMPSSPSTTTPITTRPSSSPDHSHRSSLTEPSEERAVRLLPAVPHSSTPLRCCVVL